MRHIDMPESVTVTRCTTVAVTLYDRRCYYKFDRFKAVIYY